ncbi:hypothetical protein M595_1494 [Lyngbya aestuarii BL J]|uniref:Uncharacterized protein n=1 Tax=Lyngbya aestuarii BL J TaxID=1348334 RepID=U7QMP3_9CYAN|nr:hypothetical protein M595_1494 [Lyngbya aestuarii BL J]
MPNQHGEGENEPMIAVSVEIKAIINLYFREKIYILWMKLPYLGRLWLR